MAKLNMVQAINLALHQQMDKDESVVIMGEDVGVDGGVFRVTDGLLDKFGERRVLDTPLAESGIVGTAIGMAMGGLKPVTEMQFSGFSYYIMHQIEAHASRLRTRTRGALTVPIVVRMPYGAGVRALEHHSESRETFYAHQPGLKVVMPSTPRNARALLVSAIQDPDPVVFLEPKRSYRAFREEVPEQEENCPIGKAHIVQEGTDLTLVAWGSMMRPTLAAAEEVADSRGAKIEIIDLLTIAPMDAKAVTNSVAKTGRCVIVQEAPKTLGPASELIAHINDRSLLYLQAPVARVTGFDVVTPYFGREQMYLPDVPNIAHAINDTLDF